MASQTQLEILIKTVAQTAGITVTEQEVKKLTETLKEAEKETKAVDNSAVALAKQFGEANDKAAEFGRSLKGLSNDQMLAVEDRLKEQIRTTREAGGSTDELKRKLQETFNQRTTAQVDGLGASLKRASGSAGGFTSAGETLAKTAQQASQSMGGLQRAAGGLAQGGFAGLVNVVGGLTTAFKGLAVGAISTVLLPAIAALGGAILLMKKRAEESQKAMDKMWAEAAKNAKIYDDTLTALNEKNEASQKRQLDNLDATAKKYAELSGETARTQQLTDRQTEAQKKIDLAAAKTPEERAAVEARYEEASLDTRETRAQRDQGNASREIAELRAQAVDVEATANEAQKTADDLRAKSLAAFERAKEAGEALTAAQTAYDSAVIDAESGFAGSAAELVKAKEALDQATLNKEKADQVSAELAKEGFAARDAASSAFAKMTETLEAIRARMKEVEFAAKEAEVRLTEINAERTAQQLTQSNAAESTTPTTATTPNAPPSSARSDGAAAAKLYDLQTARAAEVAAAEAEIKALEDQKFRLPALSPESQKFDREIASRRSALDQGNRSFEERFEIEARSAQQARPVSRSAPSAPASDNRQIASTLEKASAAQQDRDRVIIKFAEDTTKSAENTKRQILNSRQKSQP